MKLKWERLLFIKGKDSKMSFDLGICWYNANGKAFIVNLFHWRLVVEFND